MMDREKVIDGLEKALAASKAVDIWNVGITVEEAKEALELLKEPEAYTPSPAGQDDWICGNCGETVGWEELDVFGIDPVRYKFCPGCGRKVKWDEDH